MSSPSDKEPQVGAQSQPVADHDELQPPKDTHVDDLQRVVEADRDMTLWQAAKEHKRILLYCIAPFCAGFAFGYDSIVNGAAIALPAFLIYYGEISDTGALFLPSIWTSLWTAMSALCQALAGVAIGVVSDRFGRKWCCVMASLLSIGAVAVQYYSATRGALLAGKMLNGVAIGCLTATSTAWAAEVAPPASAVPSTMGLLAVRLYVGVMEPRAFREVFAIQFVGAGLAAIAFAVVPESPSWLAIMGRMDAAKAAFETLYRGDPNMETRFRAMCESIEQEKVATKSQSAGSWAAAFRGSNLKRSLTVMWIFLGTGLTGASLLAQGVYFLLVAGLPPIHSFDIGLGGFGVALFAIIASWLYMEKLGRRSLWMVGAALNTVIMLIIGTLYFAHNKPSVWAVAVLMNILLSWQIVTLVSPGWAITGEISSYSVRIKTQSIAVVSSAFASWFFAFIVPFIYNTDAGNLGLKTGFVFATTSLILTVCSYFLIPDLRGFTTQEIDWLYENKIPIPRFQDYADGRATQGAADAVQKTKGEA